MISIGFFNNKGGVGKTTLLCNVAASLSLRQKRKVLILDADPQCNASAYLLSEAKLEEMLLDDDRYSIDTFFEPIRKGQGYSEAAPLPVHSNRFNVDLIVGDPKLSLREDLLATDWQATMNGEHRGFQTTYAISELLSRVTDYDVVLVDMGPSLGALNRSALLAVDYFVMPLSVDIFSLMAVSNILQSFKNWRSELLESESKYKRKEGKSFCVSGIPVHWHLKFAGQVAQQYTAKAKGGIRQAVGAYERILNRQTTALTALCDFFEIQAGSSSLGDVPILHSVVPLSQQVHAPIFSLNANDGIVGSHYRKVEEAGAIYHSIASNLMARIEK